jgi:hypothetical protein
MRAGGADLAMMLDRRFNGINRTNGSVLRRIFRHFIIEDAGPLGKHG